jgi:hypothetical protein
MDALQNKILSLENDIKLLLQYDTCKFIKFISNDKNKPILLENNITNINKLNFEKANLTNNINKIIQDSTNINAEIISLNEDININNMTIKELHQQIILIKTEMKIKIESINKIIIELDVFKNKYENKIESIKKIDLNDNIQYKYSICIDYILKCKTNCINLIRLIQNNIIYGNTNNIISDDIIIKELINNYNIYNNLVNKFRSAPRHPIYTIKSLIKEDYNKLLEINENKYKTLICQYRNNYLSRCQSGVRRCNIKSKCYNCQNNQKIYDDLYNKETQSYNDTKSKYNCDYDILLKKITICELITNTIKLIDDKLNKHNINNENLHLETNLFASHNDKLNFIIYLLNDIIDNKQNILKKVNNNCEILLQNLEQSKLNFIEYKKLTINYEESINNIENCALIKITETQQKLIQIINSIDETENMKLHINEQIISNKLLPQNIDTIEIYLRLNSIIEKLTIEKEKLNIEKENINKELIQINIDKQNSKDIVFMEYSSYISDNFNNCFDNTPPNLIYMYFDNIEEDVNLIKFIKNIYDSILFNYNLDNHYKSLIDICQTEINLYNNIQIKKNNINIQNLKLDEIALILPKINQDITKINTEILTLENEITNINKIYELKNIYL